MWKKCSFYTLRSLFTLLFPFSHHRSSHFFFPHYCFVHSSYIRATLQLSCKYNDFIQRAAKKSHNDHAIFASFFSFSSTVHLLYHISSQNACKDEHTHTYIYNVRDLCNTLYIYSSNANIYS